MEELEICAIVEIEREKEAKAFGEFTIGDKVLVSEFDDHIEKIGVEGVFAGMSGCLYLARHYYRGKLQDDTVAWKYCVPYQPATNRPRR